MPPAFRVVHVDSSGYHVYPSQGDPWDKGLAEALTLLVRAGYALSRELGKPIGTVKVDWPDGTVAVVRYGEGGLIGIVVEPSAEAPRRAATAGAEGVA